MPTKTLTAKIKIKALSVNGAWQGRRFKTQGYKDYEALVYALLPKIDIPKGRLSVRYTFGLSSKNADIDNGIKPFTDILQKKYGFNDKNIYRMQAEKVDVKKGEEFIEFEIKELNQ